MLTSIELEKFNGIAARQRFGRTSPKASRVVGSPDLRRLSR